MGLKGPGYKINVFVCVCVCAPRPFYHSIMLSFSAVAAIFKNEIENGKAQRNLFRAWLLPLIVAEYINMNVCSM